MFMGKNYEIKSIGNFRLISFLLFASFLLTNQGEAQPLSGRTTIKGQVVNSYGNPINEVSVKVKGNSEWIKTDANGSFEINANLHDKLIFNCPGYDETEEVVKEQEMSVRLNESYLQEPDTINVLYERRPKNQVIGSISTVYNNQLITTPATQYTFGLAGRLAGFYVQQNSGWPSFRDVHLVNPGWLWPELAAGASGMPGPNDNTQMLLSLRGQTPVTIIDGVQRSFYSMPPEDIESISVLKDGLSTILLGQRSSRGVLLITTKRSQRGKPQISFTGQTGLQSPLDLPEPVPAYKYAWLYNEGMLNSGRNPIYSEQDFRLYSDGSDPMGHPDVNWYKTVLRDNAPMSRYNLNIGGGGNVARYTMSAGYMNQQGLFKQDPGTPYKTNASIDRYTINTHIDVDVNKYFNVGLTLFGRIEGSNQPGAGVPAIMSALMTTPNNANPVFNPNGSLAGNQTFTNNVYGLATNTGYISGRSRDVMANLDMKYNFDQWVPGLWTKLMANISVSSINSIDRSKMFSVYGLAVQPSGDTTYNVYGSPYDQRNAFRLTAFAEYVYGQASIGYDHDFDNNNHLNLMIMADQRQETVGFDLPNTFTNLAARASYGIGNKYFIEGATNYSGYDRFPPGNRFGLFYAGGVKWNMAEENFMKDNFSWIDRFNWNITYGKTANANVGYFVYEQAFNGVTVDTYFGNAVSQATAEITPLANPHVTWEKANKYDVNADISMFKNRLELNIGYFNHKYYDLMWLRGKANPMLGNSYPLENIAKARYSGWELEFTYKNRIGRFNWFVTGNGSLMKTKVLYLDEARREYPWNMRTGQPVGQIFGYIADGLYQTQQDVVNSAHISGITPLPGDIKYEDLNGDGVIDDFDVAPIGTTKPQIFYGVTGGFNFRGISVSVLLQGVKNRDIMFSGVGTMSFYNFTNGQAWEHDLGRWTPQTASDATSPRVNAGFNQNSMVASSYWLRSGDYFRIKNVEVGYSLPYYWLKSLNLGEIYIFTNGLNLFTHSKNPGVDPEISPEVSGAVYPIVRIVNFGVRVRF